MRRTWAGALLSLAAACDRTTPPAAPAARPHNVLLIVADTLRADRLSCYGYPRPTSPTIDSLAQGGLLYVDARSNACWTVPSMISMFSGLYVTTEESLLPVNLTLPETFRARGFETSAFVANPVLYGERGFERGFECFEPLDNVDAFALAQAFQDWILARRDPERGFFAWMQFIDPHHPYEPREEIAAHFTSTPPAAETLIERWEALAPRVEHLAPGLAAATYEDAVIAMSDDINRYDGEVRMVDEGVRAVLDALAWAGELEQTLIIVCSDHGEMLYEQPHGPMGVSQTLRDEGGLPRGIQDLFVRGHRPWYFEDLWNTPLVFHGPGVPAGERRRGLACNVDLYPTLLEAFDWPSPPGLQGHSLWGGRKPERQRAFAYGHHTQAVVDHAGQKLIVYPRFWFELEGEGEAPAVLFDLQSDPDERTDLAQERPEQVRAMRAWIEHWQSGSARPAVTTESLRAIERLQQMGYVGGK